MEIKDPDILKWVEQAKSYSKELKLPRPFHVVMGEAVDAARECDFYWEAEVDPDTGNVIRLGLSSVNTPGKQRLSPTAGTDLKSIQKASQAAHGQYLYTSGSLSDPELMAAGKFYLREIISVLNFEFNDGVWDENDAALASLAAEHADDPQSADALASALDDYVGLAHPIAKDLDGMAGFKSEYLDKARETAAKLREKPAVPAAMPALAAEWLDLRNQLTNMLMDNMGRVNAAGKLVYRDRPDIARKFASAYERKRRAEARRKAKKKEEEGKGTGGGGATG